MILCAAPAYLKRRGAPKHPSELDEHTQLFYTYWLQRMVAFFTHGLAGDAALRCNNGDAIAQAAAQGAGCASAKLHRRTAD